MVGHVGTALARPRSPACLSGGGSKRERAKAVPTWPTGATFRHTLNYLCIYSSPLKRYPTPDTVRMKRG